MFPLLWEEKGETAGDFSALCPNLGVLGVLAVYVTIQTNMV